LDRRKFIAMMSTTAAAVSQASAAPLRSLRATATAPPRSSTKPLNVILFICDDIGFGDLGSYGSKLPTPNLDRMAADGMRFVRHNGGHPLCSASRAAILTGRYGTRMGVVGAFGPREKAGADLDETIISQLFKAKGYKTAAIGKWHLGVEVPYLPTSRGFDSYFGLNWSVDMTPKTLMKDTMVLEENTECRMLIPRYNDEAQRFIDEHGGKNPFFLYYGFPYPHDPPDSSPRFTDKSRFGKQGDAIAEIDWAVGEVIKKLEAKGLSDDTLILFTGDHGPWMQGCPGNLRGRKATTFEGGFRVPFLAKLPGVVPAGGVCDSPTTHLDVLPTIAKMCGLPLPEMPLDGADVSSALMGAGKLPEHTQIYFSPMSKAGLQPHCIRQGDWKVRVAQAFGGEIYINDGAPPKGSAWLSKSELYNVALDPGESYNVANLHPEIVKTLTAELDRQITTFPQNVQDHYALLKQTVDGPRTPTAAAPRFPDANKS
jgi:arylsulfatase A